MRLQRFPKLHYQTWSKEWKDARHVIGDIDRIVRLLNQMPTHQWTREQLVEVLGFRKNTDEDKGEQTIERQLLGVRGTERGHNLLIHGKRYHLKATSHNVALSRHKSGQVIADALGIVDVSSKCHPLAIEIKVTQGNCWSAVVQNIQQVKMLRNNHRNTKRQLKTSGGAWGIVLAPRCYYDKNPDAVAKSINLLKWLKDTTKLRVALCYSDGLMDKNVIGKKTIECFYSNWR